MALVKNFSEGTKFYYVRVSQFKYDKNADVLYLTIEFRVRDSSDENLDEIESIMPFGVDNAMLSTPGSDFFSIIVQNAEDKNFISESYEYLKAHIELFKSGWTDV